MIKIHAIENEQQQGKEKSGHEPGSVHCASSGTHQLYVEALGAARLPAADGSAGNRFDLLFFRQICFTWRR
jgi:hypothetical protein